MFTELNRQILYTLDLIIEKRQYERLKTELLAKIETQSQQQLMFQNIVDKEHREVRLLEKPSFFAFYYKVLGRQEKQLYKEQAEYQEAAKQLDLLEKALFRSHGQLYDLEHNLASLGDPNAQLQNLKQRKENIILTQYSENAMKYKALRAAIQTQLPLCQELEIIGNELRQTIGSCDNFMNMSINVSVQIQPESLMSYVGINTVNAQREQVMLGLYKLQQLLLRSASNPTFKTGFTNLARLIEYYKQNPITNWQHHYSVRQSLKHLGNVITQMRELDFDVATKLGEMQAQMRKQEVEKVMLFDTF